MSLRVRWHYECCSCLCEQQVQCLMLPHHCQDEGRAGSQDRSLELCSWRLGDKICHVDDFDLSPRFAVEFCFLADCERTSDSVNLPHTAPFKINRDLKLRSVAWWFKQTNKKPCRPAVPQISDLFVCQPCGNERLARGNGRRRGKGLCSHQPFSQGKTGRRRRRTSRSRSAFAGSQVALSARARSHASVFRAGRSISQYVKQHRGLRLVR